MAEESSSKKSSGLPYIAVIVILLIVVAGQFFYFSTKKQAAVLGTNKTAVPAQGAKRTGAARGMAMGMEPITPPALSDQQKDQLAATTKTKTFNITAGNYYFVPNKITVQKGDSVTFVVTNGGGFHNLKIDELGVKTDMMKSGGDVQSATFTASKSGSFVYYCGVPGHRAKGMWGTLVVE